MKTKNEIIAGLSQEQIQALVQHFNNIYECPALSDHEHKMIYLVRMKADGILYRTSEGILEFDPHIAGVSYSDYEITFEDDNSGGVNLDLTWDFHDLDKVHTIMNW
jgi:hypothetical protein